MARKAKEKIIPKAEVENEAVDCSCAESQEEE